MMPCCKGLLLSDSDTAWWNSWEMKRGMPACVLGFALRWNVFVGQDYKNIDDGVYKLPWDMTTRGHRQWSPFWVARRSAQV